MDEGSETDGRYTTPEGLEIEVYRFTDHPY